MKSNKLMTNQEMINMKKKMMISKDMSLGKKSS